MAVPLIGDERENSDPPSCPLSVRSGHCRAHRILHAASPAFHCSLNNTWSVTATLKQVHLRGLQHQPGPGPSGYQELFPEVVLSQTDPWHQTARGPSCHPHFPAWAAAPWGERLCGFTRARGHGSGRWEGSASPARTDDRRATSVCNVHTGCAVKPDRAGRRRRRVFRITSREEVC